jgi:hypothetical protein
MSPTLRPPCVVAHDTRTYREHTLALRGQALRECEHAGCQPCRRITELLRVGIVRSQHPETSDNVHAHALTSVAFVLPVLYLQLRTCKRCALRRQTAPLAPDLLLSPRQQRPRPVLTAAVGLMCDRTAQAVGSQEFTDKVLSCAATLAAFSPEAYCKPYHTFWNPFPVVADFLVAPSRHSSQYIGAALGDDAQPDTDISCRREVCPLKPGAAYSRWLHRRAQCARRPPCHITPSLQTRHTGALTASRRLTIHANPAWQ